MGTMLFAAGLQFGDPPEVWNLSHPDVVRRIQRGYLEAGSRILLTNTFGGNRLRLGLHGLQDRVAELNRTAAELAREVADAAPRPVVVAGSNAFPAASRPASCPRWRTYIRSRSSPASRRRSDRRRTRPWCRRT